MQNDLELLMSRVETFRQNADDAFRVAVRNDNLAGMRQAQTLQCAATDALEVLVQAFAKVTSD